MGQYRTKPDAATGMPAGIPYIIGNEAAERFSFYGMKAILVIYMTQHLRDAAGEADTMGDEDAKTVYHLFTMAAYFFPILGALLSDIIWGKYKTILLLSLGYCIGHGFLALGDTGAVTNIVPIDPVWWLFAGLAFIAMGAGGIKPCVSAHVGDQFGAGNKRLLPRVFSWFYFAINTGAFASQLLTPVLLDRVGPWLAFGLPGALMAIATFIFWLGRNQFVHVPPSGMNKFVEETFSPDGRRAIINLAPIFLIFIPMFWALFDQTGSAWVLQATKMDTAVAGTNLLPSQIQAFNPLFILLLIPLFSYVIYPRIDKFFRMTPLRKISIGLFLTAIAFSTSALIEENITGGEVTDVTSIAPVKQGWQKQKLIDGEADGYGWASSAKAEFPHEISIRLREREAWTIESVALNPFTWAGAPDGSDPEAEQRFVELSEEQQQAWIERPDESNWARDVTVLVRASADAEPVEVGSIELAREDRLQRIEFDPVEATHVILRVESSWGGPQAKLGVVRVLAAGAAPGTLPANSAEVWPDVASLGYEPHILWQVLAYILLTAAEIMVSITALEFAYTQAPKRMKSFVMGIYFLGVSFGNLFTAAVNFFIQNRDGTTKLEGASYYWFFTVLMAVTAVIFIFYSMTYRGQSYIQGEGDDQGDGPSGTRPTDPAIRARAREEGIGNV